MSEKPPESPRRRRRSRSKAAVRRRQWYAYHRLEGFDRLHLADGSGLLVGVDEAGRGALAGPVVAAAVVLPRESRLVGVKDSKQLDEDEREGLFEAIVRSALSVGIGMSHPRLIDSINILNASLTAMAQAVRNLRLGAAVTLIDGRDTIVAPGKVVAVVEGDRKSLSIAAASVIAKVARDRVMRKLHKRYPAYNFLHNKGYGTKDHIEAINAHGVLPEHRRSFDLKGVDLQPSLF